MESDAVDGLIASATRELTPIEAREVRCLVLEAFDTGDTAVLGQAMTAPTLAQEGLG
jgi:hypothetical protein